MAILVPGTGYKLAKINPYNSTTYVDMLGIEVGLTRLQGETSTSFLRRIALEGISTKDHTYATTLQRIAIELGLSIKNGITISSTVPLVITSNIAGLAIPSITLPSGKPFVSPLLTIADDNVWIWRFLSDVVRDLNTLDGVSATLNVPDAPALQLAKQTNYLWSTEAISSNIQALKHTNIQWDTITFNNTTPSYSTNSNIISFSSQPLPNTNAYYSYIANPFDMVTCDAGIISLLDPGFSSVATRDGSVLTQQVKEVLQDIMTTDRSYWGK
jgi:hypothetical protein